MHNGRSFKTYSRHTMQLEVYSWSTNCCPLNWKKNFLSLSISKIWKKWWINLLALMRNLKKNKLRKSHWLHWNQMCPILLCHNSKSNNCLVKKKDNGLCWNLWRVDALSLYNPFSTSQTPNAKILCGTFFGKIQRLAFPKTTIHPMSIGTHVNKRFLGHHGVFWWWPSRFVLDDHLLGFDGENPSLIESCYGP